jgi:hypothetical protein
MLKTKKKKKKKKKKEKKKEKNKTKQNKTKQKTKKTKIIHYHTVYAHSPSHIGWVPPHVGLTPCERMSMHIVCSVCVSNTSLKARNKC